MKIKKHIFRLLSLLMLLCVFTTQVSALAVHEVCVSNTSDDENQQPVLRQLTHETVVPSYDFSFGEVNRFFEENNLTFQFFNNSEKPVTWFSLPENSYLAKLLEHHIAINAP